MGDEPQVNFVSKASSFWRIVDSTEGEHIQLLYEVDLKNPH